MTDPTAAEAVARTLVGISYPSGTWDKNEAVRITHMLMAYQACDALGIDPDSPLSLLHWHATQQEQERCASIAENAGRANGQWIADEIRRSDRL